MNAKTEVMNGGWWGGSGAGRRWRLCVGCGAISVVVLMTGCTSFRPGEASNVERASLPLEPVESFEWPARRTEELSAIVEQTPRAITRVVLDPERPGAPITDVLQRQLTRPIARVEYSGVHGVGIIRVMEGGPAGEAGRNDWQRWAYSSMRFVSRSDVDQPTDLRWDGGMEGTMELIRWRVEHESERVGEPVGVKPVDPAVLKMLYEGRRIRVTTPRSDVEPRGTVVHMAGLGSLEYEEPVLDELLERGWCIVRISTPSVWWFADREYTLRGEADVPVMAEELARRIDDLTAESAYAAEAALDYLAKRRPEIPQKPLVMLGFSAGSLSAPAVAARLPGRFAAAVLVGSGANLLEISQTSDLTNAGIVLRFEGDAPRGALRSRLFREYLQRSRMDPYHTARAMRSMPVLLVQANIDSTVPHENGTLLAQRLGNPDQYTHVFGHRLLFFTLSAQARRIADWIDDASATARARGAVARQSSGDGAGASGGSSGEAEPARQQ